MKNFRKLQGVKIQNKQKNYIEHRYLKGAIKKQTKYNKNQISFYCTLCNFYREAAKT